MTFETLCKQVAHLLDEPEATISETENLLDRGLDSIRMMSLVESWRQDGVEVDFITLAENPTLSHWWELISSAKRHA
ncbi:bifunctional isochorismate lyase/aryl carrier protein [Croceifilum oryzae]|uniref:Bifunctional isochorismate lyase/aryl carrier protein n=1 Tax=Croceifilum oryzae TaxID=1553429 RepID=A0AAJ1WR06_9BACL|nr:bifunctional isochorismate lyase/aryl carrier protein [Croceifilum oryzae]